MKSSVVIKETRRDELTPYRITVTSREKVILSQNILMKPMDAWTLNITAVRTSEGIK